MKSEILQTFDERRNEFKPYGLTCELWSPSLMRKPDRHNEIEINYFTEGGVTYLFQGRKVVIPPRRLAMFWGLVPHQIIDYQRDTPYYVCTIPFSQFLAWKLSPPFIDRLIKGEVTFEATDDSSLYDEYLLKNWLKDIQHEKSKEVVLLEMRARLSRMALSDLPNKHNQQVHIYDNEISHVEKIALFIAQNYHSSLKVSDIGKAVGLHPDYANMIFKKAFGVTLSEYVLEERIAHAQRRLVSTRASITSIAYECGFNSISRFNAAFRKINKCTPREFRGQL